MEAITKKLRFIRVLLVIAWTLSVSLITKSTAQQDPQFTQYMFNTLSVNSAYAGQRDGLSMVGLNRTQWVGIDGAPTTQSIGIHSPISESGLGLGLSVVVDALGPAEKTFADLNLAYTISLNSRDLKLSFGLKAGFYFLNTDWSQGVFSDPDVLFNENLTLTSPIFGSGLYMHTRKWYLGLSVPNFLENRFYDDFEESLESDRIHLYGIGGYVLDISESVKFKPSFFFKQVSGTPFILDTSANFLINDNLTLGFSNRWRDSVSALAGFQISDTILIGYSYDLTTTNLRNYNRGSHEIFLRFEFNNIRSQLSPRFF